MITELVQRRVNALLLLDAGWSEVKAAEALFLDVSTIKGWRTNFEQDGLRSVRLSEYSRREGHLTQAEEQELTATFQLDPPRDCQVVRQHIERSFRVRFSRSCAIALMKRLGFTYKKPKTVLRIAEEVWTCPGIPTFEPD